MASLSFHTAGLIFFQFFALGIQKQLLLVCDPQLFFLSKCILFVTMYKRITSQVTDLTIVNQLGKCMKYFFY